MPADIEPADPRSQSQPCGVGHGRPATAPAPKRASSTRARARQRDAIQRLTARTSVLDFRAEVAADMRRRIAEGDPLNIGLPATGGGPS